MGWGIEALKQHLPPRLAQWHRELLAGQQAHDVDAFLLASVMDRETMGGTSRHLDKPGPGGRGDAGHGHGLMQIDDRSHLAFILKRLADGRWAWEDPLENVVYGAKVLAEGLRQFAKVTPPQLARAAGIAAYNCGATNVKRALARTPPSASLAARLVGVDFFTAGQNYSQDVLRRYLSYLPPMPPVVA